MLTGEQIAELADVDARQRREMVTLLLEQANAREELQARHEAERVAVAGRVGVQLQPGTTQNELPLERPVVPASRTRPAARPEARRNGGG